MVVNFLATLRFSSLTLYRFVRTLLPMALVSAAMYVVVRGVAPLLPGGVLLRLIAEVGAGVVCYLALSALFRLEAFREVTAILRAQLKR